MICTSFFFFQGGRGVEFFEPSLSKRREIKNENENLTTHVRLRPVDGVVYPAARLLHADPSPLGLFES